MWFLLLVLNLWAAAALYVDCRYASLRFVLVVIYLAVLGLLIAKAGRRRALSCLLCFCVVLGMVAQSEAVGGGELAARRGSESLG